MIYIELFWSFFQVGLFSIGGGLAALPLIQNQVVDMHQWLNITEFTDLITISEMTPGPIAINSSTFVGTRIAGLSGALIATIGCVIPSCIIVMTLAWLYKKYKNLSIIQGVLDGLRPAVVALIASSGLSILILAFWGESGFSIDIGTLNPVSVILFSLSLFILRKWKPSPIAVMFGCGIIGCITYMLM